MKGTHGSANSQKIKRMSVMALLSAAVIVLQIICTFIRFGPFSITLALTPILVGGALYGLGAGTFLGAIFGIVVLLTGFMGWDGGTVLFLFGQNAIGTILICVGKGALAGLCAAAVSKVFEKKQPLVGSIGASVVCPIVNTGLFILGMTVFFMSTLNGWASGQNLIYYIIFGLCGVNFVVELIVNLLLSSAVNRIVSVRRRVR